jgi:hypothetical protein
MLAFIRLQLVASFEIGTGSEHERDVDLLLTGPHESHETTWSSEVRSASDQFSALQEKDNQSSRISLISRSTIFFDVIPCDSAEKFVMIRWVSTDGAMASKSSSEAM